MSRTIVRPGGRNGQIRGRVLRGLLAELEERPFHAVTMSSLAARSRVSRATVHRRWSSTDAVLAEALDTIHQGRMARGLGLITRSAPEREPEGIDLVVGQLRSLSTWLSRPRTASILLPALAIRAHDEVIATRLQAIWAHELDDLRRTLHATVPLATPDAVDAIATRLLGSLLVRTLIGPQRATGTWLARLALDEVAALAEST